MSAIGVIGLIIGVPVVLAVVAFAALGAAMFFADWSH